MRSLLQKVGGRSAAQKIERRGVSVKDQRCAVLRRSFQRIEAQEEVRQLRRLLEGGISSRDCILPFNTDKRGFLFSVGEFLGRITVRLGAYLVRLGLASEFVI